MSYASTRFKDGVEYDVTYLSVVETAKLVRAALKKAFPIITFRVKSERYAGGASIDVYYTDGPTPHTVESVSGQYCGGRFDGSIDMAYSVEHVLFADGSAMVTRDSGTEGSRGCIPALGPVPTPLHGTPVMFGADFIHVHRQCSRALLTRVFAEAEKSHDESYYDFASVTIKGSDAWGYHFDTNSYETARMLSHELSQTGATA